MVPSSNTIEPTDNMLIGKHLNHYYVSRWLGSGNHGDVYLAQNTLPEALHNAPVALKILKINPEWDQEKQQLYFKTFHKEALLMKQLDHSNLARFEDFDYANGFYFLVQNYIPGDNLRKILHTKKELAFPQLFSLWFQLCWGLEYLHDKKILHLDLKPENMILQENGVLKITDYGSAYYPPSESLHETRILVNTLKYAAPEQINRKTGIDARTDLFALGLLFYEFLYGTHPFPAENQTELVQQICHEAVSYPPRQLRHSHNQQPLNDLQQLITHLLQKEKVARPANIRSVLSELWRIHKAKNWTEHDEEKIFLNEESPK